MRFAPVARSAALAAVCWLLPTVSSAQLADSRSLDIRDIRLSAASVPVGSPVEITADFAANYDNPFDPDQVAVDALVTTPGGKTVTVPGFLDVPMRLETTSGREKLSTNGTPTFRVRYTPVDQGKYQLVLQLRDKSGTFHSRPLTLSATASQSPGFIRVSRQSPRYFAFDDGRPYFAVGENVCWSGQRKPVADYTAWFKGLGGAGGNWARLWLAFNEKGLEWMPQPTPKPGVGTYLGLGRYSPGNAWRLDQVVRLARENGVYLMFCLGTYGEFTQGGYFNEGAWESNPYNMRNSGPCASPSDFWTNAEARRLYKNRLRYLVARWGYSPNVFAWEFWNEVPETPKTAAWVAEMAGYLKSIDPNRHLVSTTYGNAATWKIADVDFTMTHMYGQAGNTADFTSRIEHDARQALPFNKPYLLAEFGIDWQTGDQRWDRPRSGLNMHNGAWAAMMSGAAGTAMLWYWDGYVHPHNLYHVLTPVRKFADAVDWARTPFLPLSDIRLEQGDLQSETFTDLLVPATIEWGRSPSNSYTVGHDGTVRGGPVALTIGSPKRGNPKELPSRLTWRLDMPRPGTITARLGEVCTRARLQIAVDGQVKVDRELTAGAPGKGPWKKAHFLDQWKVWVSDYDEEIAIDVPAGKHDIAFANVDGDWLQVRSLRLPRYRSSRFPAVDSLGLASDHLLLLWFHNQESTWRTEYDGKKPSLLRALRARVPATSGTWQVAWWNTSTGEIIRRDQVSARNGELTVTIPDFSSDIAARVERPAPGRQGVSR
ncbi:MAG: hypothetical protein ACP5XB_27430 [Isosphaeraceae bacterium]